MEERDVQAELKRQMEKEGSDEVFTDGIGNVIGRIGSGKKIIAIDGHLDMVDIGSRSIWSFDPPGGEIRDGFVHGRGTADQKGGVASFVTAGRILKAGETCEGAVAEIERLIKGLDAEVVLPVFRGISYTGPELVTDRYYPALKMDAGHESVLQEVKVFSGLFGREPVIDKWLFSTNGVMTCGNHGIPTIGFGPEDESMAHAPDEKVAVNDLVAAVAFYATFAWDTAKRFNTTGRRSHTDT